MSDITSACAKAAAMIGGIGRWLESQDYNYIECNHVPEHLFTHNRRVNTLLRTFFRLCPVNMRRMRRPQSGLYPLTPQSNVAMLRACMLTGDTAAADKLLRRLLELRSPKTRNFALRQGIRIAISIYENSADDPSPLNTAWFGHLLLDMPPASLAEDELASLLGSIARYFVSESGYDDHGRRGVYFRYGPTVQKEIYNASAVISAFLLKFGTRFGDELCMSLGQRGIGYICNVQNPDGSWFYAEGAAPAVDNFHQSYILQALCESQPLLPFDIGQNIRRGTEYYRGLFVTDGDCLRPLRYDRRYTPRNTWLLQHVDGRDVAEAIILFSKYRPEEATAARLVNYAYDKLFNRRRGYMYPEILLYGKNRIPYIEFQGWYLCAFTTFVYEYEKSLQDSYALS